VTVCGDRRQEQAVGTELQLCPIQETLRTELPPEADPPLAGSSVLTAATAIEDELPFCYHPCQACGRE